MSRIGRQPIDLPQGVQASISPVAVSIQGPKGKLEMKLGQGVVVKNEDSKIVVSTDTNSKQAKANWGTTRNTIANMVHGVSEGWKRDLELHGVGYNASLNGNVLNLNVGLSHEVKMEIPAAITAKVQKTTIELESADKQLLGNFAAKIRKVRPPEPYLGKGIRLAGEQVRRKAGKAGK
ncbi:MAG: 50S ribosomal protein L6 [Deltaproteobacteria bacterium]|nr:50S ribosomal protein L6 [Deltaproteobacteria bacterium]